MATNSIENIAGHFADLLQKRLARNVFTTEDSVRYTFFASLLQAGDLDPEDIILEIPHPKINRAEIDTWINQKNGESFAIEFKYDRAIPSERNSPRTQKAGKIFNDIRRLMLAPAHRMFVYLTDSEMRSYLSNPDNGFVDFFSLAKGESYSIDDVFFEGRPATFRGVVGEVFTANLHCIVTTELPKQRSLRVYEVIPR